MLSWNSTKMHVQNLTLLAIRDPRPLECGSLTLHMFHSVGIPLRYICGSCGNEEGNVLYCTPAGTSVTILQNVLLNYNVTLLKVLQTLCPYGA